MRSSSNYKRIECKAIQEALDLELALKPNVVHFGDSVKINVTFKSKTDSIILFHPKAVLYLVSPPATFHNKWFFLNKVKDLEHVVEVGSKSSHTLTYVIKAADPFFIWGENHIKLVYVNMKFTGKYKKYNKPLHNKLCGHLESNVVSLTVE